MPAYNYYPTYYNPGWAPQPYMPQQQSFAMPASQNPQYMIQVDGEIGAKAWQPQTSLAPNTVIPLWDFDGIHVYFKSTDAYGRMNPVRKAKVVFEDEVQNLPQGQSGAAENPQVAQTPVNTENFVTKDDLKSLKDEIRQMFTQNQNGNNVSNNKGGNRG